MSKYFKELRTKEHLEKGLLSHEQFLVELGIEHKAKPDTKDIEVLCGWAEGISKLAIDNGYNTYKDLFNFDKYERR